MRLLLKMGFKIIMFTLLKLGPNLLLCPDMKHRQKWKFCGADEVRLGAFSALNLHVGVVSHQSWWNTTPLRGGGEKSSWKTRTPQPEDQRGPAIDTVSRVCYSVSCDRSSIEPMAYHHPQTRHCKGKITSQPGANDGADHNVPHEADWGLF